MENSFRFEEITAQEWLEKVKLIPSDTMTPWVRVSNNILHSLQWIGKNAITQSKRKFFALKDQDKIVCCLNVYFLSKETLRTRGFYCDPLYRGRGHMKSCLELVLRQYKDIARKAVIFSPRSTSDFYLKCGFSLVDKFPSRPIEVYDFNENRFVESSEDVVFLERIL